MKKKRNAFTARAAQWRPQEYQAHYLLGNLLARARRLDQAPLEEYSLIPPANDYHVDARIRMSYFQAANKLRVHTLMCSLSARNVTQAMKNYS
ncbi:MAG: hypothetical protein U0074_01185 [Kouleothrix sp.]